MITQKDIRDGLVLIMIWLALALYVKPECDRWQDDKSSATHCIGPAEGSLWNPN